MLQVFVFCALFFVKDVLTQECEADDQYPWSYHGPNNDPYYWDDTYPDCGKKDQSPIDIEKRDIFNLDFPELQYNGFDTPISNATIQNVGWTVMITPEDNVQRYITWGENTFILDEIHFHFGSESDPGAENVIDGIRYEMEVHYVTHEDKDPNAISVVAALMEANDEDNSAFGPITDVLSDVKYRNDSTDLQSDLNLADLFPQDSGSYNYYEGSNSVPPCQSGFSWFVLKDIGKVGSNQLDTFMTLYSVGENEASDSCLMGPNYRPEQNLDNRPIISSQ